MLVGFSTGSLARGDFQTAIDLIEEYAPDADAIELSALRDPELLPLIAALDSLDLSRFQYVSVHAPSAFQTLTEDQVTKALSPVQDRGWPIIVHPDAIQDFRKWERFRNLVCIENMDLRKPTGRTLAELVQVFDRLPEASFCFDIGHARQIDTTMLESRKILRSLSDRMREVHISTVTSNSRHESLSFAAVDAFRDVVALIPPEAAIIIESVVEPDCISREFQVVKDLLQSETLPVQ